MVSNRIETKIQAVDDFSPTFKKLGESIRGNALAANLMATGITSGIGAATAAIGKLTAGLKDAAELQLTNASAASTFAALTGKSFAEGTKFVDELNTKLSDVASKLPGTNADYKQLALGIQDNLIPAFKDLQGNVDLSAFQKDLVDITKSMTVLGVSSNTATKDVSKFTAKLLGGASESELSQLLFAENNAAFLNLYKAEATKRNIDLKNATINERRDLLKAVGQKLVTPELIKASSEGVSGLVSGLQAQLFDQDTGVFGLMRDINKSTKEKESVLVAINESLSLLIGSDGLLTELSKTFASLGLTFDPMQVLRSGILKFNGVLKSINGFVKDINQNLLPPKKKEGEQIDFTELRNKVFNYVKDSISNYLSQIDAQQIGSNIGNLINGGVAFLSKVDWKSTFQGLGSGFSSLLNNLLKGALSLFDTIDWLSVGNTLNSMIRGMIEGLVSYVKSIDYGAVLQVLLTVVSGSIIGLGYLIGGTLKTLSDIYVRESAALWNAVGSYIAGKIGEFTGFIGSKFGELTNFLGSKWNEIASAATNTFDRIKNWFNDLLSKIPFIGGNQSASVSNTAGTFVPNAATGLNVGLLEAIARENRTKPTGSNLVIANDSELILNRAQQSALVNQPNGAPSITISSLVIQTQATDTKGIVKDIMGEIAAQYQSFNNSRLVSA